MKSAHSEIEVLLRIIDEAYVRKAWHGPNLRGSLRGLPPEAAAWRPAPERHNIWEITLHAAYWKYVVWRRLTGAKRSSFPLKGSNWFPAPARPSRAEWKAALDLLEQEHRRMRAVVAALPPARLYQPSPGSSQQNLSLIFGIAAHDVYHAGQIQLLKRLQSPPSRRRRA